MDGIDMALLETDGRGHVKRGPANFYPYDAAVRKQIGQALSDAATIERTDERPGCLNLVEQEITELHVQAVRSFLDENSFDAADIDVLGFHGQTVLHRPQAGFTLQLGDSQALADGTGIATIYDMRSNDMCHGGQGAPLVPIYHKALAKNLDEEISNQFPVMFVNIGGISNITFVGAELVAFDSGPGNSLIDQWVQKHAGIPYDQGGIVASEGSIDRTLVDSYLDDPFFSRAIPKSLDRNDFTIPETNTLGVETVARSLAAVTAESVFKSCEHLPAVPDLWVVCGGGRHNPHIMHDLSRLVEQSGAKLVSADKAGFSGDFMEAEAWAYLSVRSLEKLPLTFPLTTGCRKPVTGGKLAIPAN